ncbi:MAG: phosphatidate cytidylyltransferase, partial [Clostridia bacterium]|nr:phosphatidate cytidylyltransferase [Clostridia bacterium]
YIVAAFSCMVYLCDYCGEYIYLLAFVGAWVPDTFAYFTGCLFGKHKLIPDVSPKKTVEGAIGGIVFCTIAFVVFALVYNRLLLGDPTEINALPVESFRALPIWLMAIVGVLSAVVSMIGDLSMSVIKRHYGVKDYGKILPGHGGFLDRFDSVLAVAVILAVALGIATNVGLM